MLFRSQVFYFYFVFIYLILISAVKGRKLFNYLKPGIFKREACLNSRDFINFFADLKEMLVSRNYPFLCGFKRDACFQNLFNLFAD